MADRDKPETADEFRQRLTRLMDRIEAYDFRTEGGPLKNCQEWQELRSMLGTYVH